MYSTRTIDQIVVNICYESIKYTYSLEVSLDMPDGSFCLDTAMYEHENRCERKRRMDTPPSNLRPLPRKNH